MKLINRSEYNLSHALEQQIKVGDETRVNLVPYVLEMGKELDVPEEIAKIWLKIKGIEKVIDIEAEKQAAIEEYKKQEKKVKKTK